MDKLYKPMFSHFPTSKITGLVGFIVKPYQIVKPLKNRYFLFYTNTSDK